MKEMNVTVYHNNGDKIGEAKFVRGREARFVLESIEVNDGFRRKGIATAMIQKAISEGEKLMVCEEEYTNKAHLISEDGKQLIDKLLERGIIQKHQILNGQQEQADMLEETSSSHHQQQFWTRQRANQQ